MGTRIIVSHSVMKQLRALRYFEYYSYCHVVLLHGQLSNSRLSGEGWFHSDWLADLLLMCTVEIYDLSLEIIPLHK